MTPAILKSSGTLSKLYKNWRINSNENPITKYREYKGLLNKLKKQSKLLYYRKKFIEYKNNAKLLWQTINCVIKKDNDKTSLIEKITVNGIEYKNPLDIANLFGEFFSHIGKVFSDNVPKSNIDPMT